MFVVHFLLLLVPLVLFHELGHYLVARWMGVRVLSFSIGFGPVVAAWNRDGTEYAVRLLPLGGFVRMLGDDPMGGDDDGPPAPDAFSAKPVWRRSLIVAAGPIANLILPIVILFAGSMMVDDMVVSSRLGTVLPGGPAAIAGLQSGDRVLEIDGVETESFLDVRREISRRPGLPTRVVVDRGGERVRLEVRPEARRDVKLPELGIVDTVGRIQVLPDAQTSVVQVQPGSPAWRAGLRSGDRVLKTNGTPTTSAWQLKERLAAARGGPIALEVVGPRHRQPLTAAEIASHDGELHDLAAPRTLTIAPTGQQELGLTVAQTIVGFVEAKTPAERAGLRAGDELLAVDGEPATSFLAVLEQLRKPYEDARLDPEARGLDGDALLQHLRAALARPHTIRVRRAYGDAERDALLARAAAPVPAEGASPLDAVDAAVIADAEARRLVQEQGYADVQVALALDVRLDGNERPKLNFGAGAMQGYERPELVANTNRLAYAWQQTHEEMGEATRMTVLTVAGLFRGQVPVKEVGGPIFMAQLASRTAELGWGYFFRLMVWLSVNLAILNLLPIPIADGGHLLFLGIEAVRREPVSLRTRMIAAYAGMTFLGLLFVVVMMNDVQRLIASLVNG